MEGMVSKMRPGCWFLQCSMDEMHSFPAEVDRYGSAVYLVGQYSQLVVYLLVDQKPVQLLLPYSTSEYNWLELNATQRCSSPAETLSGIGASSEVSKSWM